MATALISLDEYLHTNYEPDVGFVDGLLAGRNTGTRVHGMLHLIAGSFFLPLRRSHGLRAMTECRLLLNASNNRHRIPDVMVIEEPYLKGTVITDIPAIVIEIKSPDDILDEVIDKCLEYADLGICNIVVLAPDNRRAYIFRNRALQMVESIVLQLPKCGKELLFPVDRMFAELE